MRKDLFIPTDNVFDAIKRVDRIKPKLARLRAITLSSPRPGLTVG